MKLPKSITALEFELILKRVRKSDKEAKLAFILAYGSGLRLSEVCSLRSENIRDDLKPHLIEILQGKGGKDRQVPLPKQWKPEMKNLLPIKKK